MTERDAILACDQSTKFFGLCIGGPESEKPRAFTVKLPGAEAHVFDRTLSNAADTVSLYCRNFKVSTVVIEAPIITTDRSSHTMVALMQLTGAVRAAAHRSGARIIMVASSTVRKHFIGHGRPENPKQAVMDRCRLLGWEVSDDNAADAAAAWSYAMSITYPKWAYRSTPLYGHSSSAEAAE